MIRGSAHGELVALKKKTPQFFAKEADRASRLVRNEVRDLTPIGTRVDQRTGQVLGPSGRLKRSIRPIPVRRTSPTTWTTGAFTTVEYAHFVEHGTKPHVIEGATALRFWSQGQLRIRKRVNHPGAPGHFMFARGALNARAKFMVGADARLENFVDRGIV
jgi:hypothetical protein